MKYILCRPCGGFNDTLCQIEHCWLYARKYNRVLIVDTTCEGSGFLDHFSNYFDLKYTSEQVHLKLDETLLTQLSKLPIFPKVNLRDYHIIDSHELYKKLSSNNPTIKPKAICCTNSNINLRLNFNINYREDVVMHQCWGGGPLGVNCLRKLIFKANIASAIKEVLDMLPKKYVAIHIRNTDQQQDYRTFFQSIFDEMSKKDILICSDDYECREYAKKFFSESNIITVSNIPKIDGPLHTNKNLDRFETNLNMLKDLIGLSRSEKIYFTYTNNRGKPKYISGFKALSNRLQQNKDVIACLMRIPC